MTDNSPLYYCSRFPRLITLRNINVLYCTVSGFLTDYSPPYYCTIQGFPDWLLSALLLHCTRFPDWLLSALLLYQVSQTDYSPHYYCTVYCTPHYYCIRFPRLITLRLITALYWTVSGYYCSRFPRLITLRLITVLCCNQVFLTDHSPPYKISFLAMQNIVVSDARIWLASRAQDLAAATLQTT